MSPACTLTEDRSKSKSGTEYRHDGSDRTSSVRWSVQQGVEFAWLDANKNKITSGVTYRRRDTAEGDGDNDNGVWLEFSFPLWKAPKKPDRTASQIEALERRVADLEARLGDASEEPSADDQLSIMASPTD